MVTFLNKLSLWLTTILLTLLKILSLVKFSTNQQKPMVLMSMKAVILTIKVKKSLLQTFTPSFKVMLRQREVKFLKVMKTQRYSFLTLLSEDLVTLVCQLAIMFGLIDFKLLSPTWLITKCIKR